MSALDDLILTLVAERKTFKAVYRAIEADAKGGDK